MGVINTVGVNKRDILKARSKVQRRLGQSVNPPRECFQAISILSAVINLQHALSLLETQGVAPFNDYVARLRKKTTRAAKNILLDPNFSKAVYLAKEAEEYGLEHPKMKKLIELLKLELGLDGQTRLKSLREGHEDKDSPKIIVFTQFRDTLATWNYYTDFDKVYDNVGNIKVELNILNSLIGSKNIESEFKELMVKYPEVLKVIPILIAKREKKIKIIDAQGNFE